MVRIGINPLTWTNDDLPELGEQNSLETCLTEAKQAGYEGVELGRKFPRDADGARAHPEDSTARISFRAGTARGCSSARCRTRSRRCSRT